MPIVSACGIQCCPVPTALLSAHTGFDGYLMQNLCEQILPTAEHWQAMGLRFDALYSGFLASPAQTQIVAQVFDMFGGDNIILADPVMGDEGRLYPTFGPEYVGAMAALCAKASHICPNITEASLLAGVPYRAGPHGEGYVRRLVCALARLTRAQIIITGIEFAEGSLGAAVFDGRRISVTKNPHIRGYFPGAGDVFGSVLCACMLRGLDVARSAKIAAKFVYQGIKTGQRMGIDPLWGIPFEKDLWRLGRLLAVR